MADLSKIKLNGVTYNFKDTEARDKKIITIISGEENSFTYSGLTYAQLTSCISNNKPIFIKFDDDTIAASSAIVDEGTVFLNLIYNNYLYIFSINSNDVDNHFEMISLEQTAIPTNISSFTNDVGYLTSYTETDPTLRQKYGECSTAAGTAAKTVTINGITELYTGLFIFVKFANANSKANPTLQVNSLEAKPIMRYGTTAPSTSAASSWNAGSVVLLIYDGTYWQMEEWNNTTYSAMTAAEITAGTGTTARNITPANLKTAIQTWAPVQSVNGDTGTVVVSKVQTTAGDDNTEYNLVGTATTNTNTSAVNVYQPTLLSFSKYTNNFARLTLGSTSTPGEIRVYTSASGASGYTDLKSAASGTTTRTITFPDATGTVALTSDIPNVSSWALAANKPSYTFTELTSHPTTIGDYGITDAYTKTEVDGMVSGVLHYKGTKATVSALPSSGNVTGDVWHVTADGGEYAWDGSTWQELGSTIDLSGYVPTSRTVNGKALTSNISLTASDVSALPSSTTYVSSFNGSTGAITYTAPVTSVNGQTGAVTTPNTTYTLSISGNRITLTPSSGSATYVDLPIYNGSVT